jgi:hypothetical protein
MSNTKVQAVKKELEAIRKKNKGLLRPESVVEYAKNKNTALHSQFCWDNTEAAEKYRLYQASHIIRSIKIKMISNPRTSETVMVRQYVSLPSDRKINGYRQIGEVLTSEDLRLQLIESVQVEFEQFREKLKAISSIVYKKSESISREIERERMKVFKKIKPRTQPEPRM